MTLFTNGFVTLRIPKDFDTVSNNAQFLELALINPKIPLSIKFSTTPTFAGLPEIKDNIEKSYSQNKIEINHSDFTNIDDKIYYLIVSSIKNDEGEIRRNEFFYVEDNNLYTFEFSYPYADAELDYFYLDIIHSLKISKSKYIVEDDGYRLNGC